MIVYNHIVGKILEKNENVDERLYSTVILELDRGVNTEAICKYVLSSAMNECLRISNCITFARLIGLLDSKFCTSKASEYVQFLQNSHEHSDDAEMLIK